MKKLSFNSEEFNQLFTHNFEEIKNVNYHYVTGGKGEPLLLLHGAFQTWIKWSAIMPELAKKYTLIVPDLRGLGDTSKPESGFDMKNVADDLYLLMQKLGHEKFRIAGHDLGGGVTYALAAAHPDKVISFAFLDMLIPGFGFEQAWIPQPNGQFLWFASLNSVPNLVEMLLKGRERDYLNAVLKSFTSNPDAVDAEQMNEYSRTYSLDGSMKSLGEYFRAMWTNFEHNHSNAATKVTMPTLAVGGGYSTGEMAANSLREVASNVSSVIVENTGHWLVDENPEKLLDILLTFFDKN
jgi:pimeloyl-ACP methyl ester carboxylesterase